MKALVTGSHGLIGEAAVLRLLEEGYEVVGIDNNNRSKFFKEAAIIKVDPKSMPGYTHIDADISDSNALIPLEEQYDVIIHTAAQPAHDYANEHPDIDFQTNVLGTHNILELARKTSPDCTFIHLSTTKVYSDVINNLPIFETSTRFNAEWSINENFLKALDGDHGVFGAHKLAADIMVQEYGRYYDMNTVVFRPGCITGSGHAGVREHGFLSYLVKCAKDGTEYIVNGFDGKQVRDQLHIDDLVSAFMEVINTDKLDLKLASDVFVIGGGLNNSVSILEAIALVEKHTGEKINYRIDDNPRRADHMWNVHDNTKFKYHYPNWQIEYSLTNIIKELI